MKPILEIQQISKRYRISHEARQPYLSLRDSLSSLFRRSSSTEDFWALQDVSFSVNPGESIGIIGKNGAGKSTLLKILSRITPPTSGKIISRGRIASLLEVGTGFHPELTGRENIFMNGSILGMRRVEILKNFDAIVDFAGVEKFLDTPLKHYSSGMQLRLAFAVAAFLENEVLVIDEVLAVGDAEFQKKCMGKMDEVARSGRTVLFVSHNMSAVENLCEKSVLLSQGKLVDFGKTRAMTAQYLELALRESQQDLGIVTYPDDQKHIRKIELYSDGHLSSTSHMGAEWQIKVYFECPDGLSNPILGVIIYDSEGNAIYGINNTHYIRKLTSSAISKGVISMCMPELLLFEGLYFIDVHLGTDSGDIDVKRSCLNLRVEAAAFGSSGFLPDPKFNKVFDPSVTWSVEEM